MPSSSRVQFATDSVQAGRFPRRPFRGLSLAGVLASVVLMGACSVPALPSWGGALPQAELTDIHGKTHALGTLAGKRYTVVIFLGTECPLARLYGPILSKLASEFSAEGVQFVGVMSNCQDSLAEIAAYVRRHEIEFPVLKDIGNELADLVQAERTPEAFLLDHHWQVRYHGRIDDRYGVGYIREAAEREDLRLALRELLAGQPVALAETEPVGCLIGRMPKEVTDTSITYAKQVSRIFQSHCVECHRVGEIGPFAMTEYDEVVGWAEMIAEVIREGRMPPWHANPEYGNFRNARHMTEDEKQTIYQWVANGAPFGDREDLPPPQQFASDWRLPRPPDRVIAMRDRPFRVPAEGIVEYQYFVVDPGFTEDTWVSAAEVIPGDRSVVHHCIVFVRPPDDVGPRGFGWLAAYVPGQVPMVLPPDCGRRVAAGSKLVFQMHYTPNGTPTEDLTRVGLLLADPEKIERETITLVALNRHFRIPPGAEDFAVSARVEWLPPEGELLAMAPHMHMRGKSFRFTLRHGDQETILLDVPQYDFNWQHVYELERPVTLTSDVEIHCEAHFDNSDGNLVNPDPHVAVQWGDQTWQEMMVGFLDVAVDRDAELEIPWARLGKPTESDGDRDRWAKELIARFDKDGDRQLSRDEVPTEFAVFAFRRIDQDGDRKITLEEARAASAR